jgi:tetratricopeptide (TPR) repeat protein
MKNFIDILKRTWFVWIIVLVFLTIIVRFAYSQTPEIDQAKYFTQIDQIGKAENTLKQAIAAHPEDARLWYFLGRVQIKKGEYKEAEVSFQKGIEVNDKEALNLVGKGHLRLVENNIAEAKKFFDQALALSKSKNVIVLKCISEAYLTQAAYANDAMALLQKAKANNANDNEILILLGDAHLLQNNGGLAVTSYENAELLNPKDATPEYKIGLVYLRSRNTEAAGIALNKAIQIDPSYTLAYKELGELYYMEKKADKAVDAYEHYLALTEKPELGKLRYAFFLFMAKDFQKANEVFKELIQKPEVNPITLRFYAVSLFEVGDYQQSKIVFDQYFIKSPQAEIEATDYTYYGKLLLKQGEDSLAVESFRKSVVLEKNQPDVLQLAGETLFKSKRYPEAIEAYSQLMAIRQKPVSQDYFSIGRAYYFTKQYEKADATFQKLTELQPNMTVGYLWQARAKSNLDPESENGLAKAYYEKVIEKASTNPEKGKSDLIEAYSYLGYYHFIKNELQVSKTCWEKVLALNPSDAKAAEAIRAIK